MIKKSNYKVTAISHLMKKTNVKSSDLINSFGFLLLSYHDNYIMLQSD